ncbi:hypothetical protein HY218_01580 [Candidatus Saccharibacteria bacterium]|nr:hypothetical protein [Candidatus Saccharibacteria bacterium]
MISFLEESVEEPTVEGKKIIEAGRNLVKVVSELGICQGPSVEEDGSFTCENENRDTLYALEELIVNDRATNY